MGEDHVKNPSSSSRLPPVPALWPCSLQEAEGRGRYATATEAVVAGAAVLEDRPYAAVVADAHRGYVCARCLHVCTAQVFQCGGCKQTHYCSEVSQSDSQYTPT